MTRPAAAPFTPGGTEAHEQQAWETLRYRVEECGWDGDAAYKAYLDEMAAEGYAEWAQAWGAGTDGTPEQEQEAEAG